MNFTTLNEYMEKHDFLPCDKTKVYNYINQENEMRSDRFKIINGYLTRTQLILSTANGITEEVSRVTLGIQDNFK